MPEQPLFGYKMHLAVDQGLVRRAILTPGHVSDKVSFLDLVQGDERAVYADKGYDGAWYRARLREQGIADGGRSMPETPPGTARSGQSGRRSSAPSRSSSAGTATPGCAIGVLVNNTLQLQLLAVTLNLRRALVLTP